MGAAMQTHERRQYIRHPVRFPIHAFPEGQREECFSALRDFSHGGLCFSTPRKHDDGDRVAVEIPLIKHSDALQGEVVWTREGGDDSGYAYSSGIQFLRESKRAHAYIPEQICRIETYRRSQLSEHGRELTPDQAADEWAARCANRFIGPDESI
jgi:hypothetical protein